MRTTSDVPELGLDLKPLANLRCLVRRAGTTRPCGRKTTHTVEFVTSLGGREFRSRASFCCGHVASARARAEKHAARAERLAGRREMRRVLAKQAIGGRS